MEPLEDDAESMEYAISGPSTGSSVAPIAGAEREAAFLATLSVKEKKRLLRKLIKMDTHGVPNVLGHDSDSSLSGDEYSSSSSSDSSRSRRKRRKVDKDDRKKHDKKAKKEERNHKKKKSRDKEKEKDREETVDSSHGKK